MFLKHSYKWFLYPSFLTLPNVFYQTFAKPKNVYWDVIFTPQLI